MLNRLLMLPLVTVCIWIGVLLFSTYSHGHTVFSDTMTCTSLWNQDMRALTLSASLVAIWLSISIYICRIIQIQVILEEHGQYKGGWKIMVYCWWISIVLSAISLSAGVILLYGAIHTITIGFGCFSLLFLITLYIILTCKERWILYKETGTLYMIDIVLVTLAFMLVIVAFCIWQSAFHVYCDGVEGGHTCILPPIANLMEWVGFTITAFGIWIIYIAFYYDPKAYLQIRKWWMKMVER